jgi:hypothetical protein
MYDPKFTPFQGLSPPVSDTNLRGAERGVGVGSGGLGFATPIVDAKYAPNIAGD